MNAFDYLQERINVNGVTRYRRRGKEVGTWYGAGKIEITRDEFYRDYREAVRRRDELNEAIDSMRNFIGDV